MDKTKDEIKSALSLEIKQDRESFVIADNFELKSWWWTHSYGNTITFVHLRIIDES